MVFLLAMPNVALAQDEFQGGTVSALEGGGTLLDLYGRSAEAVSHNGAAASVPFVEGEVLVGLFGDDVSGIKFELLEKLDLRGLDRRSGSAGVSGWRIAVPLGQELAIIDALLQNPAVAFALPNFEVQSTESRAVNPTDTAAVTASPESAFTVNDPFYADRQWYLQRINASRAWAMAFENNLPPVRVAIVDSGGNYSHPDFGNRMVESVNYVRPGNPAEDDYGHGSHVAGLIGAGLNDGVGMSGIAPNAQIDPRKALNSFGSGSITNVAQAIRDAADDGAKVINLSLETGLPNVIMHSAIIYAAEKGALMAAATGNFGATQVQWPAAYPEVIAVAATDYNNKRASYSSRGAKVELAAPGGDSLIPILSAWGDNVPCDYDEQAPVVGDYCIARGTSMASAIVSGVAALVWSVDPSLTADEVRGILSATAAPLAGNSNEVGRGLVDAAAAVRRTIARDFVLSQTNAAVTIDPSSDPYSVTVKIENPSPQVINWSVDIPANIEWLTSTEVISGAQGLSGTTLYGQPSYVTLVISPTHLTTGTYSTALTFIGTMPNGGTNAELFEQIMPIQLRVGRLPQKMYLPQITVGNFAQGASGTSASMGWETVNESERETHSLIDNANLFLSLPITYTLQGKTYTNVRLYSDGFLVFPVGDTQISLPNHCLPGDDWSDQIVYGWWADLDPGSAGGTVTSFSPAPDRFVIEFNNVLGYDANNAPYRVTFQMVLYENGDIGLNYRNVPTFVGRPPEVTIGVNSTDGRFYNQVTCTTPTRQFGTLPLSGQSFLLRAEDLY